MVNGRPLPVIPPPPDVLRPFGDQQSVSVGDTLYVLKQDGSLGSRYRQSGGGWNDLFAKPTPESPTKRKFRIKAFVVTSTVLVEQNRDGLYRQRQSTIDRTNIGAIANGFSQFSAWLRFVSNGTLDPEVSLELDEVPVVLESSPDQPLTAPPLGSVVTVRPDSLLKPDAFGPQFVAESIAPRVNSEAFTTDDPTERGPYDLVVAVVPSPQPIAFTAISGKTPISVLGYWHFSPEMALRSLGPQIAEIWASQTAIRSELAGRPTGRSTHFRMGFLSPGAVSLFAHPFEAYEASQGNLKGWFAARTTVSSRSVPVNLAPDTTVALVKSEGQSQIAVSPEGWEAATAVTGQAPTAVATSNGIEYLLYPAPAAGSLLEALSLKEVNAAPGSGPTTSRTFFRPTGDYNVTEATVDGEVVTSIFRLSSFDRGSVSLPPHGEGTSHVTLSLRLASEEGFALQFLSEGRVIRSVLLTGSSPIPNEATGDANQGPLIRSDNTWQTVTVAFPPNQKVDRVVISSSPYGNRFTRGVVGDNQLEIRGLRYTKAVEGTAPPTETLPLPMTPPAELRQIREIQAPMSPERLAFLRTQMGSPFPDLRLNAVGVFLRIKSPEALPLLVEAADSGDPSTVYLVMAALRFQGTEEANLAIRTMIRRGAFDINRRLALMFEPNRSDPALFQDTAFLFGNRNWRGRLEGVRLLSQLKHESRDIALITTLQDNDPCVRVEVVRLSDPANNLHSRRLIFGAVNDPSEWVRTMSALRLIFGPEGEARSEALKLVRDESVTVRLWLLEGMIAQPAEHTRPAAQLAVIDRNASVRAKALDLFAVLPEPTKVEEFQNVLSDPDPLVQYALLKLAKTKEIALPQSVLDRLAQSQVAEVATLARELGGK
jgi:HEAT repeat protein